jgi:hypothetical protein
MRGIADASAGLIEVLTGGASTSKWREPRNLGRMATQDYTVGRVFVPGGQPTVTYNPRSALRLEEKVRDYLDERHRILSVSGPTKSGKTVLIKSLVRSGDDGLYLSGGLITSVDALWSAITDEFGVFTAESVSDDQEEVAGRESGGEGGLNLALTGKWSRRTSESIASRRGTTRGRERAAVYAARETLRSSGKVLVIDDFHYIPHDIQLAIVRGLKDLVFDGVGVILLAVPHRAYDVVRVEKEMTGRVEQLEIPFWSLDELAGIARDGFVALNVMDHIGLAHKLASEAFSSPHLMQDFCLQLCKANGINRSQIERHSLDAPIWQEFFKARASGGSKAAFDLLARGPRQRSDRKVRTLEDGTATDIYGAVLAAIAKTGPLTELTYEQLRAAMRDLMSEPPARHEITRVLEEMSKIARDQIDGEPVVDYDEELSTLHISDPFFAYYLRWGTSTPPPSTRDVKLPGIS